MIRLHVIVEGQTEETFINQVLAPELWPYEVFPDAHRITTARRRGKVFRGGLTNYQQLRRDILLWILQDRNRDAYFTTMVDLYALPPDFPGYANCRSHQDPLQKVACLESKLQADIDDRRFIPYIQPHEFEALLFSDPAKFVYAFPEGAQAVQQLQNIRSRFATPEHINDREESAPSKRIESVLPEYGHAKAAAGPLILQHIGIATLRRECRHFDEWLTRLQGCR